jgi:signal peptidase I
MNIIKKAFLFLRENAFKIDMIIPAFALVATATFLVSGLGGCSKSDTKLDVGPVLATSSLSKDQAIYLARSISDIVPKSSVTLIKGDSMLPTLNENSVAVYESIDAASANVGDILIFKNKDTGTRIGHRVAGFSGDGSGIITAGDNNAGADSGVVTGDLVVGRVFAIIYFNKEESVSSEQSYKK